MKGNSQALAVRKGPSWRDVGHMDILARADELKDAARASRERQEARDAASAWLDGFTRLEAQERTAERELMQAVQRITSESSVLNKSAADDLGNAFFDPANEGKTEDERFASDVRVISLMHSILCTVWLVKNWRGDWIYLLILLRPTFFF